MPVFLPSGAREQVPVDYCDNIQRLKEKMLERLEIPTHRMRAEYFALFEVANYVNEVKDSLLSESQIAWDVLSDWD